MGFACKSKIKKAWLVASLSIFVVYKLMGGSSFAGYYSPTPLSPWLELAMIALSFPSGWLAMFVLHDARFWCDGCRSLDFLFDWSTLLFAGYIQWFWVLPRFLRSRKPTLLDLKGTPEIVSPNSPSTVTEPAKPAALPVATPEAAAPRRAFDVAAFAPLLAEFDEAGLTALGRVLQAQTRTAAAEASPPPPPPSEVIFPQVS
jgi:hypothetical protein